MRCVLFTYLCLLSAMVPQTAIAQSYQQYSDGLFAVNAKQVLDRDQRIAFEVCAQLMRQERVEPLEIRLNLWGTSGRFVTQLSLILYPEHSASICQRIQLPPEVRDLGRWEVARFRVLRDRAPLRAGRLNGAG